MISTTIKLQLRECSGNILNNLYSMIDTIKEYYPENSSENTDIFTLKHLIKCAIENMIEIEENLDIRRKNES